MHTEKERSELEASLRRLAKCSRDCKNCKYLHIYTVDAGRMIYYGYGCDAVYNSYILADKLSELRGAAIEHIGFEIKE